MKNYLIYRLIVLSLLFGTIGCGKDYLTELEPTGTITKKQLKKITEENPEAAATTIKGWVKGIYNDLFKFRTNHDQFGVKAIDLSMDLNSGDMVQLKHHHFGFDYNVANRQENYRRTRHIWAVFYGAIYITNDILSTFSQEPTNSNLRSYYAQSKTLRALAYYYLVNLYQHPYQDNPNALGVPLYTAPAKESKGRTMVKDIYTQMIDDLESAITSFANATPSEKSEVSIDVARGLLATILCFRGESGDYAKAATLAKEAKTAYPLMTDEDYQAGFNSINNEEWMWGVDITTETSTSYASFFSHVSSSDPGYSGGLGIYKAMNASLYDAIDESDVRKKVFYGPKSSYINKKFYNEKAKSSAWVSDYLYMRGAEMYLLEAEAQARNNKLTEAKKVLIELIHARCQNTDPYNIAGLSTQEEVLDAIYLQTRIELWGEGRVLFATKRFKKTLKEAPNARDSRLEGQSGDLEYNNYQLIYQLPDIEVKNNSKIPQSQQNR